MENNNSTQSNSTPETTPSIKEQSPTPKNDLNKHSIIAILLLVFFYPIGLIIMWFSTRWPKWFKFVLSIPFFVAIIGLILIQFLYSYLDSFSQKDFPTPTPAQQVACTQEAKQCPDGVTYVGRTGPKCEFEACPESSTSTSSYSDFLGKIKTLTTSNNFSSLIELQSTDEIECDPNADYIFSICEGVSKEEIKTGYWLGRNQSEGSILPKNEYTNEIKTYFNEYSPFKFVGEKQTDDKALIVFKGKPVQGRDTMIAFQAKNENGWKISAIVYGPLTEEYEKLDDILFNF